MLIRRLVAVLLFSGLFLVTGTEKAVTSETVYSSPSFPVVIDSVPPKREPPKPTPPPKSTRIRVVSVKVELARHVPTEDAFWMALRGCESQNGRTNPAGPYYGYFQMLIQNWRKVGGTGFPMDHSYEVQREKAKQWASIKNPFTQWPDCWPKALAAIEGR